MTDAAQAVELALDAAEEGLAAGELPIGAVVLAGDVLLSRAFTQERALGRRLRSSRSSTDDPTGSSLASIAHGHKH